MLVLLDRVLPLFIARGGRLDGTVVKMGTDGRCRVQLDASGKSTWAPFKDLELVEKGRPPRLSRGPSFENTSKTTMLKRQSPLTPPPVVMSPPPPQQQNGSPRSGGGPSFSAVGGQWAPMLSRAASSSSTDVTMSSSPYTDSRTPFEAVLDEAGLLGFAAELLAHRIASMAALNAMTADEVEAELETLFKPWQRRLFDAVCKPASGMAFRSIARQPSQPSQPSQLWT